MSPGDSCGFLGRLRGGRQGIFRRRGSPGAKLGLAQRLAAVLAPDPGLVQLVHRVSLLRSRSPVRPDQDARRTRAPRAKDESPFRSLGEGLSAVIEIPLWGRFAVTLWW